MKITIESTTRIVLVNGVPTRVWQGTSEGGLVIAALVAQIAVDADAAPADFGRELEENAAPLPAAMAMFPYAAVVIGYVPDDEPKESN